MAACLMLCGIPKRRRVLRSILGALAISVTMVGGLIGCSSGTSGGGAGTTGNPGTTAGAYTVTVTGTSGALTATSTVTVTVQ